MNINELNSCELITLASTISIIIGEKFSNNEVATVSALLMAIADNLAIIALNSAEDEK